MQKTMPPLRALVAFEAAVRRGSFKQAAEELSLTPGAVSQQVRKLEQWLGFALFLRQTRQLEVTDSGAAYYSRIAPALEQIAQVSADSRARPAAGVRLSLPTALAAKWLAPRMADFIARYPDVDVHINATTKTVDFRRESVDLAIRRFDGNDPALEAVAVYADEGRLYCSPAYRERLALTEPDDLVRATLLHAALYLSWDAWLDRFTRIDPQARARIPGLHFDQPLLGIEAAKRDQGVVLSNTLLVGEELERGELVEPFGLPLVTAKGYYLVHPRHVPLSRPAQALKAWLLAQFGVGR